jgi:hypothetical protein
VAPPARPVSALGFPAGIKRQTAVPEKAVAVNVIRINHAFSLLENFLYHVSGQSPRKP